MKLNKYKKMKYLLPFLVLFSSFAFGEYTNYEEIRIKKLERIQEDYKNKTITKEEYLQGLVYHGVLPPSVTKPKKSHLFFDEYKILDMWTDLKSSFGMSMIYLYWFCFAVFILSIFISLCLYILKHVDC